MAPQKLRRRKQNALPRPARRRQRQNVRSSQGTRENGGKDHLKTHCGGAAEKMTCKDVAAQWIKSSGAPTLQRLACPGHCTIAASASNSLPRSSTPA